MQDKQKRMATIIAIISVSAFLFLMLKDSCPVACISQGYSGGACKWGSGGFIANPEYVPPCSSDETGIGPAPDCNPQNLIGAPYNCCCK